MVSSINIRNEAVNQFNLFYVASPFLPASTAKRRRQRSQVEWKQPEDNWNITTLPRSILPHLENKNYTHSLPAPGNIQYKVIDSDERMLERFHEIKVSVVAFQVKSSILTSSFLSEQFLISNVMGKI